MLGFRSQRAGRPRPRGVAESDLRHVEEQRRLGRRSAAGSRGQLGARYLVISGLGEDVVEPSAVIQGLQQSAFGSIRLDVLHLGLSGVDLTGRSLSHLRMLAGFILSEVDRFEKEEDEARVRMWYRMADDLRPKRLPLIGRHH